MKPLQFLFTVIFIVLFVDTLSAQYRNSGYGNNYGTNYGNNHRTISAADQSISQQKPKEIPIEVTVASIIERIKPELNLDELQVIAISNILTENIKTHGMLVKATGSQEEKTENIKALSEVTDRKIMELLDKDQKEKFITLSTETKKTKKPKKKKSE